MPARPLGLPTAPSLPAVSGLDRRRLLGFAVSMPIMSLAAACSSLERGMPAPESLADQATVLGIPTARFWPDTQGEALAREALAAQQRERAAIGGAGRLPPAAFLAVSGGGGNGALRHQAVMATLYSLAGMLVYLWFRFELIYGIGAVVACFHDTIITVGFFSLLNKDISLTVIAAILTLIGYSMNDTIVVFDRIRENIKLLRREPLADIVNKSINQTLSRTILTSGLTFLTVLSLYAFGGEVLRGFSLALVIGILIGTYSSIAVAAPMLVAYQDWRERRTGRPVLPAVSA